MEGEADYSLLLIAFLIDLPTGSRCGSKMRAGIIRLLNFFAPGTLPGCSGARSRQEA